VTVPLVVVAARKIVEQCWFEVDELVTVNESRGEIEFVGQHRVCPAEFLQVVLVPEDEQHAVVLPLTIHLRVAEQVFVLDHRCTENLIKDCTCLQHLSLCAAAPKLEHPAVEFDS
jgi:hypothetical protein